MFLDLNVRLRRRGFVNQHVVAKHALGAFLAGNERRASEGQEGGIRHGQTHVEREGVVLTALGLVGAREGGDVPLRQVRQRVPRRSARWSSWPGRSGAGPHPRQGPRHEAVLWQVCQSPPWDAGQGRVRGGAAREAEDRGSYSAHPN